jgi:hypothetical protein
MSEDPLWFVDWILQNKQSPFIEYVADAIEADATLYGAL